MKMMVGMGSIDDYPSYVNAGIKAVGGEIFIGYVPHFWMDKYGRKQPLNRREVLYYNVQAGSYSELMILSDMVKAYGVPVSITLNALHYEKESYDDLFSIIHSCMEIGFHRFILADPDFIRVVCEKEIQGIEITVSGEYGEMNAEILKNLCGLGVRRIIFPRQTSIEEMKEMLDLCPQLEYEAFTLNEKCHFTGAYCNSVHCDEFCHMCKIPYRMTCGSEIPKEENDLNQMSFLNEGDWEEQELLGITGCALCALYDYEKIGITHLKIVSRGNGSEATIEDIKKVEEALSILEESQTKAEYIHKMKKSLFPQGCSKNCYASLPDII